MREKDKMDIRVEIADKFYRISIDSNEEEKVRRAARRINEEIKKMRQKYETTFVDYMAMAALIISIENETNKERLEFSSERLRIKELTAELDKILQEDEGSEGI